MQLMVIDVTFVAHREKKNKQTIHRLLSRNI